MNSIQLCLIVFGGFICYFLADGFTYSVGILYSYFLTTFGLSGSSSAVLPGLLYSVPQFSAILTCPLLDTYGYSSGAAWGCLLLSISCVASAFAPNLPVLYFTLGVVSSFGLQLVFSSAIMSVTAAFEGNRFFGLAVGLTMCGSGIGSFVSSPFLAWLLESWTWREAMIIEGALLLHAMIAASCFHHLDALRFGTLPRMIGKEVVAVLEPLNLKKGERINEDSASLVLERSKSNLITETEQVTLKHNTAFEYLCQPVRYVLLFPSRYRFRYSTILSSQSTNRVISPMLLQTVTDDSYADCDQDTVGCLELRKAVVLSFRQLFSSYLWQNRTFLIYVIANGLTGAGVVIPWTFIYDHALVSLSIDGELDVLNVGHISWLPSLIGFGALFGQLFFGLLTTTFSVSGNVLCCRRDYRDTCTQGWCRCGMARILHRLWFVTARRRLCLFVIVLLLNGLGTLAIALTPLSRLAGQISSDISFFKLPLGQFLGAACFIVGTTYGGLYVLYPSILTDAVGKKAWASALGVFLFFNGLMNLIGTTVGGQIFDRTHSYRTAFLLAAAIPFVGSCLVFVELIIRLKTNDNSNGSRDVTDTRIPYEH